MNNIHKYVHSTCHMKPRALCICTWDKNSRLAALQKPCQKTGIILDFYTSEGFPRLPQVLQCFSAQLYKRTFEENHFKCCYCVYCSLVRVPDTAYPRLPYSSFLNSHLCEPVLKWVEFNLFGKNVWITFLNLLTLFKKFLTGFCSQCRTFHPQIWITKKPEVQWKQHVRISVINSSQIKVNIEYAGVVHRKRLSSWACWARKSLKNWNEQS